MLFVRTHQDGLELPRRDWNVLLTYTIDAGLWYARHRQPDVIVLVRRDRDAPMLPTLVREFRERAPDCALVPIVRGQTTDEEAGDLFDAGATLCFRRRRETVTASVVAALVEAALRMRDLSPVRPA